MLSLEYFKIYVNNALPQLAFTTIVEGACEK